MNLSIATSHAVLTVLDGGRAPRKRTARVLHAPPLDEIVHCTEMAWRSSWHERMDDEEKTYDERAFDFGEAR